MLQCPGTFTLNNCVAFATNANSECICAMCASGYAPSQNQRTCVRASASPTVSCSAGGMAAAACENWLVRRRTITISGNSSLPCLTLAVPHHYQLRHLRRHRLLLRSLLKRLLAVWQHLHSLQRGQLRHFHHQHLHLHGVLYWLHWTDVPVHW